MDSNDIRYIGQKSTNILHDKLCVKVEKIPEEDAIGLNTLDKSMRLCERCQRKIFVRNAIKDDDNFAWYLNFFDEGKYSTNEMKGFIYKYGVQFLRLSETEMQVKYNDDTWKIAYVKNNRYDLFHNNYFIVSDSIRKVLTDKFHMQTKTPTRLKDLFKYIALYDWKLHCK